MRKTLKHITLAHLVGVIAGLGLAGPLQAAGQDEPTAAAPATAASAVDMTDGEIRKVDKDNGKLTIKHGDIKNLDMPGMTMVFKVKDPAMLDKVKAGDKIRFVVENTPSGFTVTELVPAGK